MVEATTADVVRTRLVEAAATALSNEGRVSLTIARVARSAGLSTGAIYSNFDDREQLLAEAYAHRLERKLASDLNVKNLAKFVFGPAGPDFEALYEALGALCTPEAEVARIETLDAMLAAAHSVTARRQLLPLVNEQLEEIAADVARSQEKGWTRSDLPARNIAAAWVATALGSACVANLLRLPQDPLVNESARQALFVLLTVTSTQPRHQLWQPAAPESHEGLFADVAATRPGRTPAGEALLRSAIAQLREDGNVDFKLAKVAADAGLTVGTVYSQFGSRSRLIAEAHLEMLRSAIETPPNQIDVIATFYDPAGPNAADIGALLLTLGTQGPRTRRVDALYAQVEARYNADLRPQLAATSQTVIERMADIVRASQEAGETVTDVDARAMAIAWLGTSLGLSVAGYLVRPFRNFEEARDLTNTYGVVLQAFRTQPWTALVTTEQAVEIGLT